MIAESKCVLLADDDENSRSMLSYYLKIWGFAVVEARNGVEAVAILSSEDAPSIALVDWMMPGMEGVDVCKYVRQLTNRAYTYIILLTGKVDPEAAAAGLEAGADDYVTKPCDPAELRGRLKVGERITTLERTLARQVVTLQETLDHVRQLKELIPICAWCKRVRDDEDYWHSIEEYLHAETGTDFTHGICPHCVQTMRENIATTRKHDHGA